MLLGSGTILWLGKEETVFHLSGEGSAWYFVGFTVPLFCLCLDRIMSGLALSHFILSQSKLNWGRYSVRLVISNRRAEMAWLWMSDQLVIILRPSWEPQRSYRCQGMLFLFPQYFTFSSKSILKAVFRTRGINSLHEFTRSYLEQWLSISSPAIDGVSLGNCFHKSLMEWEKWGHKIKIIKLEC